MLSFHRYSTSPDPHSFPTRRSSDLPGQGSLEMGERGCDRGECALQLSLAFLFGGVTAGDIAFVTLVGQTQQLSGGFRVGSLGLAEGSDPLVQHHPGRDDTDGRTQNQAEKEQLCSVHGVSTPRRCDEPTSPRHTSCVVDNRCPRRVTCSRDLEATERPSGAANRRDQTASAHPDGCRRAARHCGRPLGATEWAKTVV